MKYFYENMFYQIFNFAFKTSKEKYSVFSTIVILSLYTLFDVFFVFKMVFYLYFEDIYYDYLYIFLLAYFVLIPLLFTLYFVPKKRYMKIYEKYIDEAKEQKIKRSNIYLIFSIVSSILFIISLKIPIQ